MTVPQDQIPAVVPLVVAALLATFSAAGLSSAWLNHDAGWYLHMAGAWLNGAVMYQDVIDTNPPLIVLLTAVPVVIARLLDLPAPATFKALTLLAALASMTIGAAILRRLIRSGPEWGMVAAALVFLLLCFVRGDFGQREHLAVILVTPYVLAAAVRIPAPLAPLREVPLGILAGLGFALKPHFLLAWIMLEVWTAVAGPARARWSLGPGSVSVAATLLAYGVLVLVFFPQYGSVASDVARVYGALNASTAALLRLTELRVWGLALLLASLLRLPAGPDRSAMALLMTATGFLLAALVQQKGWAYHLYPFNVFVGLYFAVVLATVLESHASAAAIVRGGRRTILGAVLAGLLLMGWRGVPQMAEPSGVHQVRALHSLVVREQVDSLAVLSMRTILFPAFPVVNYTATTWVMRHHSLWFLPGLYERELRGGRATIPHRDPAAQDELERMYFEQIVSDLCARPPRMLIIEPPLDAGRGPGSIDLVAYYGQDARFARLFRAYEERGRFGPFVAYVQSSEATCGAVQARASGAP